MGQTGCEMGVNVDTELSLKVSEMPSWQLGSKRPKKIVVDRTNFQAILIVAPDCIASFISKFKSKDIKLREIIAEN